MIAVLLGAFFILAISAGVLMLVALPHLRRGSRILTPQGERTVQQARARSGRWVTTLPGRIRALGKGSGRSRGSHVSGGDAAPAPAKRILKDSLALPDPAELAPEPEPEPVITQPEPVSLFEPQVQPEPRPVWQPPASFYAAPPEPAPEPARVEPQPVKAEPEPVRTEAEPVRIEAEPVRAEAEPAAAVEPDETDETVETVETVETATTTPGGGVGRQRPSPAESGPISKPPVKQGKGGSKPRSKSNRGAPRGQGGGRGARRRDHPAAEPHQVDVRDQTSDAGGPAAKRASSQ